MQGFFILLLELGVWSNLRDYSIYMTSSLSKVYCRLFFIIFFFQVDPEKTLHKKSYSLAPVMLKV